MMESTSESSSDSNNWEPLSANNNRVALNGNVTCQRAYGSIIVLPDDRNRQSNEDREVKWSPVIWTIFTFLCLYWHRTIAKKRKCYTCYVSQATKDRWQGRGSKALLLDPISLEYEYDGDDWEIEEDIPENRSNTDSDDDDVGGCEVCHVAFWDYYGTRRTYTDKDIGVNRWICCASKLMSFCGLLIASGFILYEMGYYMKKMWGRHDKLLHFMSYNAFLVCISLCPVMTLCSKLRSFYGQKENVTFLDWATTLNARFIVKRLQVLDLKRKGLPGKLVLAVCLGWTITNSTLRVFIYVHLIKFRLDIHSKISIGSTAVLLIMWGCLVYLLYVMRLSFQRHFTLALCFLKRNEGALDLCRNTLSRVILDFNCFRGCTVVYMATMIPLTVLGVTTNVSWQYTLAGSCYKLEDPYVEMAINILIWSNITMMISLSVVAIGGLDLNYVWDHFSSSVVQMQDLEHDRFWSKIVSHVRDMGGRQPVLSLTIVWSIVGFYMGIHMGDDQDIYYGGTHCVEQNITAAPKQIVGYTAIY